MKHLLTLCLSLLAALTVFAEEWTIVTDVSALKAGDTVVIACNTHNATAGAYDATKGVLSAATSVFASQNENISSLGAGTVQFLLGGSTGAWTFTAPDGSLLATTAARKLQLGGTGTTTWSISIADGNAVIASTNTACGSVQYNSGSPRFWCHTSKQTPVQLYRYGPERPKMRLSYQGFPYKRTTCEYPSYYAGATVMLAKGQPKNAEGKVVVGWLYEGATYAPGAKFTMPEKDVELVPVWGEPKEGTESVLPSENSVRKILRDGQLIIIRDGAEFNVMGGKIK